MLARVRARTCWSTRRLLDHRGWNGIGTEQGSHVWLGCVTGLSSGVVCLCADPETAPAGPPPHVSCGLWPSCGCAVLVRGGDPVPERGGDVRGSGVFFDAVPRWGGRERAAFELT